MKFKIIVYDDQEFFVSAAIVSACILVAYRWNCGKIKTVKRGCHDKPIKTHPALVSSPEMGHTQPRGNQEPDGFLRFQWCCSPVDKAKHATRWLTRIGDRSSKTNWSVWNLVEVSTQALLIRDTA